MAYMTLNFSSKSWVTWTDILFFKQLPQPFELSYLATLLLHSIFPDGAPIEFRKSDLPIRRSPYSNYLHWIPHSDLKDLLSLTSSWHEFESYFPRADDLRSQWAAEDLQLCITKFTSEIVGLSSFSKFWLLKCPLILWDMRKTKCIPQKSPS